MRDIICSYRHRFPEGQLLRATHQTSCTGKCERRFSKAKRRFQRTVRLLRRAAKNCQKLLFVISFWYDKPDLKSMNNPSWLKKLAPGELQLLRDLADVVKRTALSGSKDTMTAEIRQEIERRGKNDIISKMTQAIHRSRRRT
jgi:hypothetical protein